MEKVTIVSNDSGGAEILSNWAKKQNYSFNFILSGPAIDIFKKNLNTLKYQSNLETILYSDWIICGTSWQSDIEKKAIVFAKSHNKKVISFLDHWTNYKDRYLLDGKIILPDEIWVCDKYALKIAKSLFENVSLKLVQNPYLNEINSQIKAYKKNNPNLKTAIRKKVVLFLGENVSQHALLRYGDCNYWGYTEKSAFQYFLTKIELLNIEIECIKIRPHPSQTCDDYEWAINMTNIPIEIDKKVSLIQDILSSDYVIGMNTMAMVIALEQGKVVYTCIPENSKKPCVLPHKEIVSLIDLKNNEN